MGAEGGQGESGGGRQGEGERGNEWEGNGKGVFGRKMFNKIKCCWKEYIIIES